MCKEYNGWENKPTWLIGLWVDNSPGMGSIITEVIQNSNDPESAVKEFFDELYNDILSDSGLLSDMLGWCLANVNWRRIVDKFEPELPDPFFDRFGICDAHQQVESDYNVSGLLHERKSNQRRNMSTGYQLSRMNYKRSIIHYDDLSDNAKAIYKMLIQRYKL